MNIYHVPLCAEYFSAFSSCLDCCIGHPVGGVGQVACQGFLVREACVGVLVGGAGFFLSGVQLSVQ